MNAQLDRIYRRTEDLGGLFERESVALDEAERFAVQQGQSVESALQLSRGLTGDQLILRPVKPSMSGALDAARLSLLQPPGIDQEVPGNRVGPGGHLLAAPIMCARAVNAQERLLNDVLDQRWIASPAP